MRIVDDVSDGVVGVVEVVVLVELWRWASVPEAGGRVEVAVVELSWSLSSVVAPDFFEIGLEIGFQILKKK